MQEAGRSGTVKSRVKTGFVIGTKATTYEILLKYPKAEHNP